MDVRKLALLMGAAVVAIVTALMAKSMFSASTAPTAEAAAVVPVGPEILVATRSLPVGTIIQADAFKWQPWPKDLVQNVYYIKGQQQQEKLWGSVVRNEISAGQPATQGSLVQPGDRGFLAAALGPGMRAVTVSVNASSSVAGFVFPGDRVDLMLTQSVAGGGDGSPLKVSETIVRNMRVLATDQRFEPGAKNDEGQTEVKTFTTVTLEATPKISEKIAVAQTMGQLSLSLRSIADNNAELERAIAAGEVTVPNSKDPKAEKQVLLAIASQPIDRNTTYTTGGEVSRFERTTVPGRAGNGAGGSGAIGGPVVRIARGNAVTEVPVGAKK